MNYLVTSPCLISATSMGFSFREGVAALHCPEWPLLGGLAIGLGDKVVSIVEPHMTVRLWDPTTGKELQVLPDHGDNVNSVAYSSDGKYVLTGGADQTARLWEAQTGQELLRFTGHRSGVLWAVFSADGKYMLTASEDRTVRIWYTDYYDTIRGLPNAPSCRTRRASPPICAKI